MQPSARGPDRMAPCRPQQLGRPRHGRPPPDLPPCDPRQYQQQGSGAAVSYAAGAEDPRGHRRLSEVGREHGPGLPCADAQAEGLIATRGVTDNDCQRLKPTLLPACGMRRWAIEHRRANWLGRERQAPFKRPPQLPPHQVHRLYRCLPKRILLGANAMAADRGHC